MLAQVSFLKVVLAIWVFLCFHKNFKVFFLDLSLTSVDKEFICNAGDPSLIPGLGKSTREGIGYPLQYSCGVGIPCGSAGKESTCNVGDLGLIPVLGRSPGEGKGYPLQYSGLENSMDCTVHGVTKSRT